ncbi:MAG: NAD-dependent deacylase [Acidobacteria bacterium]|nr:NAD-dependent deacylase [Acidobacteriota bacterium]
MPHELESEAHSACRSWIRAARSIAVLTGAGVSAESGIPTFRGPDGLWRTYRPQDLATPEAFLRDPILVWEWYLERRQRIAATQPNPAHFALARLELRTPRFALVTQNVDGLHGRAGSRNVLPIHGDIGVNRCLDCGREERPATSSNPPHPLPPRCLCGGMQRPGVVWFGEPLPAAVWQQATEAVRSSDLFLVIGTSAAVYPAASLIPMAKAHGARVVEINPSPTPYSESVDLAFAEPAGKLLPHLVE